MSHSHSHDDHDHSHGHSHVPVITGENERKVLISFFLIFSFMIVEAVGGFLSGSLALIADAGHMLSDAVALGLAFAAFYFGRRAADSRRTFGYLRLEVLAGFLNALTLLLIVVWIVYEAWGRFREPVEVLAGPMFAVAVVGLLVNILVFWILTRGDSEHINIKGAALHVLGDLLGSVGAVVAAIVIYWTGWTPIDPILSVFVSLLVVRSAWILMSKSIHILLEGAPEGAAPEAISTHLLSSVDGLAAVDHIHVWMISTGHVLATMHVRPQEDEHARRVVEGVEMQLRERFQIDHATVAIDWNESERPSCSLSRPAAAREGGSSTHGHDHEQGTNCNHDHTGHDHAGHVHDGEGKAR